MEGLALWAVIGGVALLGLAIAVGRVVRRSPTQTAYRAKPLMTANEREFFGRIRRAVPDCGVYPQVPILALMEPNCPGRSPAFRQRFREISNRRVDWLVENGSDNIIIELDDRTHDVRADRRRDAVLGQAGYRVLRYQSRDKPSVDTIRHDVRTMLGRP